MTDAMQETRRGGPDRQPMKLRTKLGVGAVAALTLVGGALALRKSGYDAAGYDRATAEATATFDLGLAEARLNTAKEESAVCFALSGLRQELGHEGSSGMHLFGDEHGIYGDVYVDLAELDDATALVEDTLSPTGRGVLANAGGIEALAAVGTAEAATPSVQAEFDAAGAFSQTRSEADGNSYEQAQGAAVGMLDQARNQVMVALGANGCDPDLYAPARR